METDLLEKEFDLHLKNFNTELNITINMYKKV